MIVNYWCSFSDVLHDGVPEYWWREVGDNKTLVLLWQHGIWLNIYILKDLLVTYINLLIEDMINLCSKQVIFMIPTYTYIYAWSIKAWFKWVTVYTVIGNITLKCRTEICKWEMKFHIMEDPNLSVSHTKILPC